MPKKSSNFKFFGIILILLGLAFIIGFIPLGSFCLGVNLLVCGGFSIPLGWITGIVFAVIGTVVYRT